jgi:hypothetical protein
MTALTLGNSNVNQSVPAAQKPAGKDDRVRGSYAVSQRASRQAAERRCSEKRHCVIAHNPGAFVFWDQRLNDGVADGRALHQAEADKTH